MHLHVCFLAALLLPAWSASFPKPYQGCREYSQLRYRCKHRDISVLASFPPEALAIDLHDVRIDHLTSTTFSGFPSLERLSCTNCGIAKIDSRAFGDLPYLRYLDLEDNYVNRLDADYFGELAALEELNVANNKIDFIDPELFQKLPLLKKLNVAYNKIHCLDTTAMSNLQQLEEIDIRDNIIDEDCHNKLVEFDNQRQNMILHIDTRAGQKICEFMSQTICRYLTKWRS